MMRVMTLRGYSGTFEKRDLPANAGAVGIIERKRASSMREASTRQEWLTAKESAPRPSTVVARQALTSATGATSKLEQQLDLVEMLIAVGPEVRDQGTLQESLRALAALEDDLAARVAELTRACGDVRARVELALGDRR
jgi:hypothetical protein